MKLLIKDSPLQLLPTLAAEFGLNEAIMLQQIHYWLQHSKNVREGYKWVYKTVDEWQQELPFWSTSTIERILKKLEKQQLIVVDNFNRMKIDRTKWYRINYKAIDEYFATLSFQHDEMQSCNLPDSNSATCRHPFSQSEGMESINLQGAIPREYTKELTENNYHEKRPKNQLNNLTKQKKRPLFRSSKKTEALPDWFQQPSQSTAKQEQSIDYETARQKILQELGIC